MIIWQCVWNHHLFSSPCNCQSLLPRHVSLGGVRTFGASVFHWPFAGAKKTRHDLFFGAAFRMLVVDVVGNLMNSFPQIFVEELQKKHTSWGLDVISQIFTELRGFGLVTVAIAMSYVVFFPHDGIGHCTVKTSHLNVKSKRYSTDKVLIHSHLCCCGMTEISKNPKSKSIMFGGAYLLSGS